MNKITNLLLIALLSLSFSCTLDPKYQTPKVELPFSESEIAKKQISLVSWQEFFASEELQKLIKLALENNRDLKVATLNIESAQAIQGSQRANLLPTISAVASETRQKAPGSFAAFMPKRQYRANLSLTSYEIDFFGRLRSLKKSALEDYLASKEAMSLAKISLITEVVNSYAQLLVDKENLKISEETLFLQQQKYEITQKRYNQGIDSQATLLQMEILLESAKVNNETYKKLVAQDKNALMLLLGVFDEKNLISEITIDDLKINEDLLEFVASKNLLLRPDIKQAEHNLKSANANIGAARAAFFPSISLSGTDGYGSRDLNNLFKNPTWTYTPQINLPIFTGGRNFYNLKEADVRKKIEIVNYEKAIQNAFREALDYLAERKTLEIQLKSAESSLVAVQKITDMSDIKLQQGVVNSLSDFDIKINLLSAKQNRNNLKKEYISNIIMLYKVMGGGSEL